MIEKRIKNLPHWAVSDSQPGFYDTESKTVVEQTAKLYKAIQDAIDVINNFCDDTEKTMNDFQGNTNQDIKEFKIAMEQKFRDFTETLNLKYSYLDYMLQNIENLIKDLNEGRGS